MHVENCRTCSLVLHDCMCVSGAESGETLERWTFNVETDRRVVTGEDNEPKVKDAKVIKGEIQAIIRQITASVSFLPLLCEDGVE